MAKYEVILVQFPNLEPPDNLWWTSMCPAMPGTVSDGLTREEALLMIADCYGHLHLEEGSSGREASGPGRGAGAGGSKETDTGLVP